MTEPIRPAPTEFSETLRAWKRSATEWLGLDPAEVIDLDVSEEPWGFGSVEWESTTRAEPTRGAFERFDVRAFGDKPPLFTGHAHLDYDDGVAMLNAIGPRPRVMSTGDEIRLRQLLSRDT